MLEPKLKTLAWQILAQEIEVRKKQLQRSERDILERMNARGVLRSGMTVVQFNELYAEELQIRAKLALGAFQRVLATARVQMDESVADAIKAELNEYIVSERQRLRSELENRVSPLVGVGRASDLETAAETARANVEVEIGLSLLAAAGVAPAEVILQSTGPVVAHGEYDVFISHASEDKEAVARPLAELLRQESLRVWYDDFTLTVGDSLRARIDAGLAKSRFGVVILSPHFFKKHWPQAELNGLAAREIDGVKVILPVWHGIGVEVVRVESPMLADRLSVSTEHGLDVVVAELLRAIRG